jgi:hypothetical protein
MKLVLMVGYLLCLAWRGFLRLRAKEWRSLALDIFLWCIVFALALMVAELKGEAERSLWSYQTGHALSFIAGHLSSESGVRKVKMELETQLNRDLRVRYSDLGNLIVSLSVTNNLSR